MLYMQTFSNNVIRQHENKRDIPLVYIYITPLLAATSKAALKTLSYKCLQQDKKVYMYRY